MVCRSGSPTSAHKIEAMQSTEYNTRPEPQLMRLKLSRITHKSYMRRLLNQTLDKLRKTDDTLEL